MFNIRNNKLNYDGKCSNAASHTIQDCKIKKKNMVKLATNKNNNDIGNKNDYQLYNK